MPKRLQFRTRFGKQGGRRVETLFKSARRHYYQMFPSIWKKLSWKGPVLVRSEILGLFFKTLTAEYTYSYRNMLKFQKQLQNAVLSETKAFSQFFIEFLKSTSSLEHFEEKDERSS